MQNFSLPKKWGPQRKDFGGRYGFPGFHRVFVSTTDLESFSLRGEKFPKRFSFGGGRVRFFLLCFRSPVAKKGLGYNSADRKRDRRKGATSKNVKNRQKVSKIISTLFDNFRAGPKTSKIIKECQNNFRQFSRGTTFPAPWGGL